MLQFKLEKFEGPLGLLLQLIEDEQLDITEISLAKIADQYIEYLKSCQQIKAEEMADFLVVAAKLLLIKSKALLPYLYSGEEEEIEEFEEQLKMYREFLAAAKKIEEIIRRKKFMFSRDLTRAELKLILAQSKIFSPPKKLAAADLLAVFCDLISKFKPLQQLEEVNLAYTVKIEDKIRAIHEILIKKLKFTFDKMLIDAKNKTEIIVSFLALLELIKQRHIIVAQEDLFGQIEINKI